MNWFNIIFPLAMILFPALFMTLVRPNRDADIDLARARRLTGWLWLATLAAVGLWAAVYVAISPRLAFFLWPLFFPLFFGFLGPLMRAKNPDWVSMPPPDLPARAASLTPRLAQPVVPPWASWMLWIVWAAFFVSVVAIVDWGALHTADPALSWRRGMGWTALAISGGIVFIAPLVMVCLRMLPNEPQPLDPEGSQELIDLFARRRKQRAWLIIGLGVTMLALHGTFSIAMALISRGMWTEQQAGFVLGVAGGIAGSIVGIAGGVAGTMSSIQAVRINRRLRELTQASA